MVRLLGLLILIVDAIVVYEILQSNKDFEKKLLWIIAVIFLPVIGPVLYVVINKR